MIISLLLTILFFSICKITISFTIKPYSFDKRCSYIYDLDFPIKDPIHKKKLSDIFESSPLLVFRFENKQNLCPYEFIDFLKIFDKNADIESLKNISHNHHQILNECDKYDRQSHFFINDHKNIDKTYLWNVDFLTHPYKLPGIVTGLNVLDEEDFDESLYFISGETVFNNLSNDMKDICKNMIVEVNNKNFLLGNKTMNYYGTLSLNPNNHDYSDYTDFKKDKYYIPIAYGQDGVKENHRILMTPHFIERIVGWSKQDSQKWIDNFFKKNVLPFKFRIQCKSGDIIVYNNRRFMYSHEPNILNRKTMLKVHIPTLRPLTSFITIMNTNLYVKNLQQNSIKYVLLSLLFYTGKIDNFTLNNFSKNLYHLIYFIMVKTKNFYKYSYYSINNNKYYICKDVPSEDKKNTLYEKIYDEKISIVDFINNTNKSNVNS